MGRDSKDYRWSLIVFWDEEAIHELHKKEMDLWNSSKKRTGYQFYRQDQEFIVSQMEKFLLKPYWPIGMPNDEKANVMVEFDRKIYPIWQKYISNMEISEISAVHQADNAIRKSGIKPNRNWREAPKGQKAELYRAKDLIKERWHEALGD